MADDTVLTKLSSDASQSLRLLLAHVKTSGCPNESQGMHSLTEVLLLCKDLRHITSGHLALEGLPQPAADAPQPALNPFTLPDTHLKILQHVRSGPALARVSQASALFRVMVRRAVQEVARREFPGLILPLPWTCILGWLQAARLRGSQAADDPEQDHEHHYMSLFENSPVESMGALVATVAAVGGVRRNKDRTFKAFCNAISRLAPQYPWAVVQGGALGPLLQMLTIGTNEGDGAGSKEGAAHAAGVLGNLASSDAGKDAVMLAGAIPPLVALLRHGADDSKTKAAGALQNIAISEAGEAAVIGAGVIQPLIALLKTGSEEGKTNAAGLIGNVACSGDGKAAVLDAGAVDPLVDFLREGGDEGKVYVAGALRNLASSDKGEHIVLRAGAVGPLVALLSEGTPAGKSNAVVALRNLARSDEGQMAVIDAGVVGPLIRYLREGDEEGRSKAAGLLSTIAISDAGEAAVVKGGAVEALVAFLGEGKEEGVANAAGALWNISDSDGGKTAVLEAGAIGPLINLFARTDEKCKTNAAHALWNIASSAAGKRALLAEADVLKALIQIFNGSVAISKVAVGMCLWHIAACEEGRQTMGHSTELMMSLTTLSQQDIYFEYLDGPGCSWKAQDHAAEWIYFQVSKSDNVILDGGVFKRLLQHLGGLSQPAEQQCHPEADNHVGNCTLAAQPRKKRKREETENAAGEAASEEPTDL